MEPIEFGSADDDLVGPEGKVGRSLSGHPIPLPAALAAELAGPSRS